MGGKQNTEGPEIGTEARRNAKADRRRSEGDRGKQRRLKPISPSGFLCFPLILCVLPLPWFSSVPCQELRPLCSASLPEHHRTPCCTSLRLPTNISAVNPRMITNCTHAIALAYPIRWNWNALSYR